MTINVSCSLRPQVVVTGSSCQKAILRWDLGKPHHVVHMGPWDGDLIISSVKEIWIIIISCTLVPMVPNWYIDYAVIVSYTNPDSRFCILTRTIRTCIWFLPLKKVSIVASILHKKHFFQQVRIIYLKARVFFLLNFSDNFQMTCPDILTLQLRSVLSKLNRNVSTSDFPTCHFFQLLLFPTTCNSLFNYSFAPAKINARLLRYQPINVFLCSWHYQRKSLKLE